MKACLTQNIVKLHVRPEDLDGNLSILMSIQCPERRAEGAVPEAPKQLVASISDHESDTRHFSE